jgi:molybdopterin synthase catalytic subunit
MRHIAVLDAPLDVSATHARLADPGAGASVVFAGHVRDHSPGKTGVTHLEYEAYEEQVVGSIGDVVDEAVGRWPLLAVSVEHRVGTTGLGDPTVIVGVSSAHRADAFEAARYLIDELKARAPIWKKEFWPGGEEWSRGS